MFTEMSEDKATTKENIDCMSRVTISHSPFIHFLFLVLFTNHYVFVIVGKGGPYFSGLEDQASQVLLEEPSHMDGSLGGAQPLSSPSRSSPHSQGSEGGERFSRKVFVGGLPPDIDEDEITASFRRFGPLVVDWPHKAESKSYFPPKGYAFLLFQVSYINYFCIAKPTGVFGSRMRPQCKV